MKVFTVERNRSIKLKHAFLNTCLCELSLLLCEELTLEVSAKILHTPYTNTSRITVSWREM